MIVKIIQRSFQFMRIGFILSLVGLFCFLVYTSFVRNVYISSLAFLSFGSFLVSSFFFFIGENFDSFETHKDDEKEYIGEKKIRIIDGIMNFGKIYVKENSPKYLKSAFVSYIASIVSFLAIIELMFSITTIDISEGIFLLIMIISLIILLYDIIAILYFSLMLTYLEAYGRWLSEERL
jgi:hypothetical protein